MASLTVQVYDPGTASWIGLATGQAEIERRMGGSSARFTLFDASPSDRIYLLPGRQVKMDLSVEGQAIRFRGYVDRPAVISDAPKHFNIEVSCVGLEHNASLQWMGSRSYGNQEAYTTVLLDLWSILWNSVDRTKVVTSPKALPAGESLEFQYVNLAQATDELVGRLEGYAWWMEWDGTTMYLRCEPRGNGPIVRTLSETDVLSTFEMDPSNPDVRNVVSVIGGRGGGPDPNTGAGSSPFWPAFGQAGDSTSQGRFGVRILIVTDSGIETNQQCVDRAEAEVRRRAWPTWRVRFGLRDWTLNPGDRVVLNMPTLGLDGSAFGRDYVVESTLDRYRLGIVTREVEFSEIVPPSLTP